MTRLAQPLTALASVGIVIWVLAGGFWPALPLVASLGLLGAGLLAEPVARRAGHRTAGAFAPSAAALAALAILALGLADPHPVSALLWIVALLLGAGLVSGPLGRRLIGGRPAEQAALPAAALTAMLVFIWTLAHDGYGYFTDAPAHRFTNDDLHAGTVRIVILLLFLVLAPSALGGARMVRRLLPPGAATAALAVLLLTLGSSSADRLWPQYPYWSAAAVLGVGLVADPLIRLLGLSPAKVLAARVDELKRTRSGALDVQATELRRIERDLHDGAQVRLIALSMKLGRAEDLYRDDPKTAALLREAREDATAAIRELRELARGIAPPVLAKRGLDAAVRSLAQRSGIEVTVSGSLTRRLLPAVEAAAYFVIAESLANAAKHATGARVEIRLHERSGDLFVEITDFGPGGADPAGSGLTGLRQRVEALDGVLHVTSPAGVGTQVEAVMPCGR